MLLCAIAYVATASTASTVFTTPRIACTVQCPQGYAPAPNNPTCPAGTPCTVQDCCWETCASTGVDCVAGDIAVSPEVPCAPIGGICTEQTCCKKTCQSHSCTQGLPKDAQDTPCPAAGCDDALCCESFCDNHICSEGASLTTPPSAPCRLPFCTDHECCARTCQSHAISCPKGYAGAAKDTPCSPDLDTPCSAKECCELTCASAASICEAVNKRVAPKDEAVLCPGQRCNEGLCCSAKLPTCASFVCPDVTDIKTDPDHICSSGCDVVECCTASCAHPSFVCASDHIRRPTAHALPCPGTSPSTCSDSLCCTAPDPTATPTTPPATTAPNTSAPSTEAPDTDPPRTEPPRTEAPETDAPRTESPKTESPRTDAPMTPHPSTVSPATEAPKTGVPATGSPMAYSEAVGALLRVVEVEDGDETVLHNVFRSEAVRTPGGVSAHFAGTVVPLGALAFEVLWRGTNEEAAQSIFVNTPDAFVCNGGPCVIIATNVNPSDSSHGVYQSTGEMDGFASVVSDGEGIVVTLQGTSFRASAPHSEVLTIQYAAMLLPDAVPTALCTAPSDPPACLCSNGTATLCSLGEAIHITGEVFSLPEVAHQNEQEVVSSTAIFATAGITAVLGGSGVSSGGALVKLSLISRSCPSEEVIELDHILNPLHLKLGSQESMREVHGAQVGGVILLLALAVCSAGVAGVVWWRLGGERRRQRRFISVKRRLYPAGVDVRDVECEKFALVVPSRWGATEIRYILARGRFGWLLIPITFIFGGAVLCCASTLFYSTAPLFQALSAVEIFLLLMFVMYCGRAGVRSVMFADTEELQDPGFIKKMFWGEVEWQLRETGCAESARRAFVWVDLHRLAFDGFKKHCRCFFGFELLVTAAVAGVAAWNPNTTSACETKSYLLLGLMAAFSLILIILRPYIAWYENIMVSLVAVAETTLILLVILAAREDDAEGSVYAEYASYLSVGVLWAVTVKTLLDLAIFVIDEHSVWTELSGKGSFLRHLLLCGNTVGTTDNFVAREEIGLEEARISDDEERSDEEDDEDDDDEDDNMVEAQSSSSGTATNPLLLRSAASSHTMPPTHHMPRGVFALQPPVVNVVPLSDAVSVRDSIRISTAVANTNPVAFNRPAPGTPVTTHRAYPYPQRQRGNTFGGVSGGSSGGIWPVVANSEALAPPKPRRSSFIQTRSPSDLMLPLADDADEHPGTPPPPVLL